MATNREYKFKPYWSPREIQDGVHCGETAYDVYKWGEKIGDIAGMTIGDDWEKTFYFRHVDGRSGYGTTRVAAIEEALSSFGCDWCFDDGTVDWKGGEVPCPFCSGGPTEALPCNQ